MCQWHQGYMRCSSRPPPRDPKFTILVALLTVLLSVPIVLILNFVLDAYASNVPGSQDFGEGSVREEENEQVGASDELLRAGGQSEFEEMIRNDMMSGPLNKSISPSEFSQQTYAGEFAAILFLIYSQVLI